MTFLEVAVQAAQEAGAFIAERLGTLKPAQIELKGQSDYVTEVDRESERLIVHRLRGAFPHHEICGEESSPLRVEPVSRTGEALEPSCGEAGFRWHIDPLDGTRNYIHGFPMFCVSVALQQAGQIILGVIYDPLRQELFAAERGRGAFLNQQPIHVSGPQSLGGCLLATGFPFRLKDKGRLEAYLRSFRDVLMRVGEIRRAGSAALDLAYTACGRVDGFWELGLAPWDIAAGALLVTEAGGLVSDFHGTSTFMATGNILAGSPTIHAALMAILHPLLP